MRSQPLSLRVRARTGLPLSSLRSGLRGRSPHGREQLAFVAPPPPERKLAAILAADVEGYSRLMHEDEEATLATLSSHRAIIDSHVAAGRGHIIGSAGDSVLAEFASIIDAVHCGVAIQQALAKANAALAPERRMELRIGINVGDVMVRDGSVFGDDVNVAARLEGLAAPGGICITRSVRDQVQDRVEYGFDDLGEQRVKNIARPVEVFRLVFDPHAPAQAPAPLSVRSTEERASEGSDAIEISFWQSVESGNTAAEYHAYLERYPNGSFAALAQSRLFATGIGGGQERSVELAFWESVRDSGDPAMFLAYLEKYPNGEFKSLAEIRLEAIRTQVGAPTGLASLTGLLRSAFSSEA
jgi:adenylate cyclase